MTDSSVSKSGFLAELTAVIEKNISNEQFGVTELAEELNMSRSTLLRKVKKESTLSVAQLISQVRLQRAMELLLNSSLNVSEVSHEVGFNSTSYFIKCFREYYGYPPGEATKQSSPLPPQTGVPPEISMATDPPQTRNRSSLLVAAIIGGALMVAGYFVWSMNFDRAEDKSIAVLPFKNDSNDSTNLYLINGLMESTLNKLQQIRNLRVISRTSVEKYRNTATSIPEMANDLNVKYFVEGSGQKMGDQIVLNIQLIDATDDRHLWSKQYRREASDIFELQEEIAKNITEEIEVIITPDEKSRIEKKPTNDLAAYDFFLKGKDHFYRSSRADLEAAVEWFQKAIERDPKFSLAYANLAMVYYYLDIFNLQKPHTDDIDKCAEKAILYDAESSESMIAKALSFAQKRQYELSIPYFEKALEYDPRSGLVLHFLTEFYNIHIPHPPKYLEYAIRKVKVDVAADSATASFNYFHLSNALLQNGFIDEALKYNKQSLQLNRHNFFAGFVNDYILFAKDHDAKKAKDRLLARWQKDTTRFDILHEVGKMNFLIRDFETASACYDRALATMQMFGMDIFKHEYLRIATAYRKTGQKDKEREYASRFKTFADNDLTMYKDLHLVAYYSYTGELEKAIELFQQFSAGEDNFLYWILLMRGDPMFDNLEARPGFDPAMAEIERKFWKKHQELKQKWGYEFADI
ncbi:MAG TPA: helix-turn-helix domain-containing protein [Chryseosolibacter sp.]|nr:helix-turn-helix domain-containing protein [Chryseosolibacter sp.]